MLSYMIFPRMAEYSDIVNVNINFGNVTEEVFHERLCNVGRSLYAHGQEIVPVVTERSCDDATILSLFP
jgi:formiminotetrahydrofolate cyclodeaminase